MAQSVVVKPETDKKEPLAGLAQPKRSFDAAIESSQAWGRANRELLESMKGTRQSTSAMRLEIQAWHFRLGQMQDTGRMEGRNVQQCSDLIQTTDGRVLARFRSELTPLRSVANFDDLLTSVQRPS